MTTAPPACPRCRLRPGVALRGRSTYEPCDCPAGDRLRQRAAEARAGWLAAGPMPNTSTPAPPRLAPLTVADDSLAEDLAPAG